MTEATRRRRSAVIAVMRRIPSSSWRRPAVVNGLGSKGLMRAAASVRYACATPRRSLTDALSASKAAGDGAARKALRASLRRS